MRRQSVKHVLAWYEVLVVMFPYLYYSWILCTHKGIFQTMMYTHGYYPLPHGKKSWILHMLLEESLNIMYLYGKHFWILLPTQEEVLDNMYLYGNGLSIACVSLESNIGLSCIQMVNIHEMYMLEKQFYITQTQMRRSTFRGTFTIKSPIYWYSHGKKYWML